MAQPDQGADREQQGQRGNGDAEDDQGVAERDQEDHDACGDGMGRDPCGRAFEPG
ncbi:hypothetical protein D3C71_1948290 [compost metagenome]